MKTPLSKFMFTVIVSYIKIIIRKGVCGKLFSFGISFLPAKSAIFPAIIRRWNDEIYSSTVWCSGFGFGNKGLGRESTSPRGTKKNRKKHLYFYHIKNTGLAYHKCAGKQKKILMLTGGLTAIYSGMFLKSLVKKNKNSGSPLALAILLGGAFGNFLERWEKGYVTDFLFIKKGSNPPVFNIADLALFLGAFAMVFFCKEGKDIRKPSRTIVETNIL